MPLFREVSESPLDAQLYAIEQSLERRFTTVTLMGGSWSQPSGGTKELLSNPALYQNKHC